MDYKTPLTYGTMNESEIWDVLGKSETMKVPVRVTFSEDEIYEGVVIWSEGKYDSESGKDEAALEVGEDETLFFFVEDVKEAVLV